MPYEHFTPVTEMNGEMNSGGPDGIVLHCVLYFHIITIPFNCSDTGLRITDGKIGQKVMFALFPEFGTRTRSQDL